MRLPALLAAAAACWASVGTPRPAGAAVTLPATRYSEESADMGSYSIEIAIGRPPQRVRVRIDTGSGSVVAPTSRTDCPECSTPSGLVYSSTLSTTAHAVGCHTNECLHVNTDDSAPPPLGLATVCVVRVGANTICPRPGQQQTDSLAPFDGRMPAEGAGRCVLDPQVKPGPAEGCADHLAVNGAEGNACQQVVAERGYACTTPMSEFDASLAGVLSDVCPETCGLCDGSPVRFCDNNNDWVSGDGRNCTDYAPGGPAHERCFEGRAEAAAACPLSCDACGDCCTADGGGCYFYSMHFARGSIVSGSKVKDHIDLGSDSVVPVRAPIGVFSHMDAECEPSPSVDGVIGFGSGTACNPSCDLGFLDHLWRANPWMPRQFGLCLSGAAGSVDLGRPPPAHHRGPLQWLPMRNEQPPLADTGYRIDAHLVDVKLGLHSIVDNAVSEENAPVWATSAQLRAYTIAVDAGTPGLQLPLALYAAVGAQFTALKPTFDPSNTDGERNTSALWPIQSREGLCGGPVAAGYGPSSDFPPISFVIEAPGRVSGAKNMTVMLLPSDYLATNPTPDSARIRTPSGAEMAPGLDDGQEYLCNTISVARDNTIVFGSGLLKAYYAAFDVEKQRIGLAPAGDCGQQAPPPPPMCSVAAPLHGALGTCPPPLAEGEASLLPSGASCEITCDAGFHPVGRLPGGAEMTSATLSLHEAPQFVICGDGQLMGDTTCERDVDACDSSPCANGGTCYRHKKTMYECRCGTEFMGLNCEEPRPCMSNPCGAHGDFCMDSGADGYTCVCVQGWTGAACEELSPTAEPAAPAAPADAALAPASPRASRGPRLSAGAQPAPTPSRADDSGGSSVRQSHFAATTYE